MPRDRGGRIRTVRLEFNHPPGLKRTKAVRDNLSTVAVDRDCFWFGTDEGIALDRLTSDGLDRYARHAVFDLTDFIDLPLPPEEGEVDIEGMAVQGDHLWLVGSHARTRDKPDLNKGAEKSIEKLEDTDPNPNRWTLARIPLVEGDGGRALSRSLPGSDAGVAWLPATEKESIVLTALRDDKHLSDFLKLPAKENGFDIEGLAIRDDRLLIGLRGPVLRGWAIVLELKIDAEGSELRLRPIGPKDRPYRKHFLNLEGCGVRDLCFAGNDLLVLAGPTMALDGAIRLHRWQMPDGTADTITDEDGCRAVLDVPWRRGADRAEGIVMLPAANELLVVYDSPAEDRKHGLAGVDADVVALPG